MRLIVNVTPLLSPLTGIGHYTNELLVKLLQSEAVEDIRGVSPLRWYDQSQLGELLQCSGEQATPAMQVKSRAASSRALIDLVKKLPYARTAREFIQQQTVRRQGANFSDYLYWEPNYTLLPLSNPAVSTVHDLSHIHYPQYHPKERIKLLNKRLSKSLLRANRLIAVSEYTRQDMVKQFDIPADKIDIVSPAVCDSFRISPTESELNQVKSIYQLPENYLLSVATLEPRKNIEGLIKAFSALPGNMRRSYPLVLVGARGWLTESLERLISPLLESGEVIRLGYVEQHHLPLIYAGATAMAYVSFFEGFGMPVAESMAAGTPVITSNNSSMPEVAQGAAMLVEPERSDSIREALFTLLSDEALQQNMINSGRTIAAKYTWENSADKLLSVLSKLQNKTKGL